MGLVTKQFTFSSGTVIVASEHNTNFDALYNLVNGSLDNSNIASNAGIVASKLNLATISQTINATGSTWTDLGTITTADINGGTIDGSIIGGSSAAAGTFTNLTASTDLTLASGATVTSILDEDDMASDSDTALATQQSIRQYVADSAVSPSELFIQTGTFSTASTFTITETISSGDVYKLIVEGTVSSSGSELYIRFNSDSTSGRYDWNFTGHYDNSGMTAISAVAGGSEGQIRVTGNGSGMALNQGPFILDAKITARNSDSQAFGDINSITVNSGSGLMGKFHGNYNNGTPTSITVLITTGGGQTMTGRWYLYQLQSS